MPEDNKPLDPNDINYTTNSYSSSEEENDSDLSESNQEPAPKEIEEEFVKPKKHLLFKILIGIAGVLLFLIIIGLVLYFTGFFEPKVVEKPEPTPVDTVVEKVETSENTYRFDVKDINSKKLNEQLANLTSKNLTDEKIEEIEKRENEQKLIEDAKRKEEEYIKNQEEELLKQKAELEEKKQELEKEKAQLEAMKEEALQLKEQLENNKTPIEQNNDEVIEVKENIVENSVNEENEEKIKTSQNSNSGFLMFINVAKIKGVLYKKYLDKITDINPNVKLCRDDKNRIEIYYGPFKNSEERSELLNKLIDNKFNEAYELEFTQEEFDKRCNY